MHSVALAAAFVFVFVGCKDDETAGGDCTTPVAECASYCTDLCARATSCGGARPNCTAECNKANSCPGESRGQDSAICSRKRADLASADCTAVCASAAGCTAANDGG